MNKNYSKKEENIEDSLPMKEVFEDVKKIYANDYDIMLDSRIKNQKKLKTTKKKKGKKVVKGSADDCSEEEFMAALGIIVPDPNQILTVNDVYNAELYLKTHKKFLEDFRKKIKEVKNAEKNEVADQKPSNNIRDYEKK